MITIRKAVAEDRSVIIDFLLLMLSEGAARGAFLPFDATRENCEKLFDLVLSEGIQQGDPVLMLQSDSGPVGMIAWTLYRGPFEHTHKQAHGHGVWVAPEFRRHGWAQRLREHAEHILRTQGIGVIVGCVDVTNEASMRSVLRDEFTISASIFTKKLL